MLSYCHYVIRKWSSFFFTWKYQKILLSKGPLDFLKIIIFMIFWVHKSIPNQQICWCTPIDLETSQELCGQNTAKILHLSLQLDNNAWIYSRWHFAWAYHNYQFVWFGVVRDVVVTQCLSGCLSRLNAKKKANIFFR